MNEPYLAQVFMFGFGFAPRGYAACSGQLLPINQNQALFSILGTTYGGNGVQTFGLPDLRGRTPLSFGQGQGLSSYNLGEASGTQSVTLLQSQIPQHNHLMSVSPAASSTGDPTNAALAVGPAAPSPTVNVYTSSALNTTMGASALANTGGNLPFSTLQPYLVINFSIALSGIFPSRN